MQTLHAMKTRWHFQHCQAVSYLIEMSVKCIENAHRGFRLHESEFTVYGFEKLSERKSYKHIKEQRRVPEMCVGTSSCDNSTKGRREKEVSTKVVQALLENRPTPRHKIHV